MARNVGKTSASVDTLASTHRVRRAQLFVSPHTSPGWGYRRQSARTLVSSREGLVFRGGLHIERRSRCLETMTTRM